MLGVFRLTMATWSAKLSLVAVLIIVAMAVFGPWLAPFSPDEVAGLPFGPMSMEHWLGTDYLGRDAFSRFLNGGQTVLLIAVVATSLAYIIGVPVGIYSGLKRGSLDVFLMGASDLVYALPPAIFLLVLLASTGPSLITVILGIVFLHIPRVYRIVRLITLDISGHEYIEAAFVRGESKMSICFKDILPNILPAVCADFGVRLCGSIILYASLSYLGMGMPPPAADWGMIISENRMGITIAPWLAVAPALAIAIFSVAVNVLADNYARSSGHSRRRDNV